MEYSWKLSGLYPVSAQVAGEELERIYQARGEMTAPTIVDESRPEIAPLHPCFEWDDPVAAEKWREHQARKIVNCIVVKTETMKHEAVQVRAFVNANKSYHPLEVVLQSKDMTAEMIKDALADMEAFQTKYRVLSQLSPVLEIMEKTTNEIKREGF